MNLDFDMAKIRTTEFGIGRDDDSGQSVVSIPTDDKVQKALCEIAMATWHAMQENSDDPQRYEPSEKHGGTEYLHLPLTDDLAASMRTLHEAVNLPIEADALADPERMYFYFARMTDKSSRRLTALRRATQFKGVLKSRLLRFVTDALKLVEDRVFKLDSDFDLLVDSKNVHILRPSGFEFAGQIQDAILKAVPTNVAILRKNLPFVEFGTIQAYAGSHPRAARFLASIRTQTGNGNIDKGALKKLCKDTGVDVTEVKGKLNVDHGNIMGFLEVLDRRRYEIELVKGTPERFRAGSRSKLGT